MSDIEICRLFAYNGGIMRAAVYCGTRNLYKQMMHAAKSLLMYSNVEKIYFLIEDDIFPYELPAEIECKNLNNQTFFRPDGPNYNENLGLTYMVLIRAALSKIFPDLDKILTLDVDTLVRDNISHMWDIDLDGYYLAATREEDLSKQEKRDYINMGMAMFNLKKLREDHMDDKIIAALDKYFYRYNEQDCINDFCEGKILILPSDYNCCWQAKRPNHERIMHFAGVGDWMKWPYFHIYDEVSFNQIIRNQTFKVQLDVIILTYKDKEKLKQSINSISKTARPYINIIVVNCGNQSNYSDILKQYPYITYYYLENATFGEARQYAIEHSSGSYITFLDAGNTFMPGGDKLVFNHIKKNIFFDMYHWGYYNIKNKKINNQDDILLGYIFRREFINMCHLFFSKNNEYYGFLRACKLILQYYTNSKIVRYQNCGIVAFKETNNFEYITSMSHAQNIIDAIKMTINAHVSPYHILLTCADGMLDQYYRLIKAYQEEPEEMFDCWTSSKYFFDNCYDIYKQVGTRGAFILYREKYLPKIIKTIKWNYPLLPNFNKFLEELKENETLPNRYLNGG